MPVLVQWLLDVLPKMGNVVMLVGFLLLIFGIVGMELFKGALHYRCALPGYDEASSGDDLTPYDLQVHMPHAHATCTCHMHATTRPRQGTT